MAFFFAIKREVVIEQPNFRCIVCYASFQSNAPLLIAHGKSTDLAGQVSSVIVGHAAHKIKHLVVSFGSGNALANFSLSDKANNSVGAVRVAVVLAIIVNAVDERVEHGGKRRVATHFQFRLTAVRIDALHAKALRDADSPHHVGLGEVYQVLGKLALHDFFVMVHEYDRHVVNQVLDSLAADAAEKVAKIPPVLLVLAINIHLGAAQVAEHVTHVGKRQDAELDGVLHIENGIANIVGSLYEVDQRVANPLAAIDLRKPESLRSNAVEVGLGRKEACRAAVLGDLRVLHHRADGRVREAHATVKEVVFQLAQNAVALGVAVKILEIGDVLLAQAA